jgi:hypothetical protein
LLAGAIAAGAAVYAVDGVGKATDRASGGGLLALGGFHAVWPGIDQKHEVIRYFQLSAVAHLAVAFLPLTARATRSPSGSQSG